jgi:hypothetical protein
MADDPMGWLVEGCSCELLLPTDEGDAMKTR